jgi:hypothetical protein
MDQPPDLPTELKDKFEVHEADPRVPFPASTQLPLREVVAVQPTQGADANQVTADTSAAPKKKKRPSRKSRKKEVIASDEVPPQEPDGRATAQPVPMRRPSKDPIWVGEKLTYEFTYLGIPGGDFTLEVLPYKIVNDRKVYHVRGIAQSSGFLNMFYRVNDMLESFFDYDGVFSYRFHLVLDESKQTRDALELYDYDKRQTYYWNRWNHSTSGYLETKEYGTIEPLAQDSISSLYYVRTVPLPTGKVFSFPVISEGKTWEAVVTVVRREMLDTVLGKIPTVVLKPETKFQGVLQKKGDNYMWLTDDERHILVRVEAHVKIGTFVGKLKKFEMGTPPLEP